MVERARPGCWAVTPKQAAVPVDDYDAPGAGEIGEQYTAARKRLGIGRVRDGRLDRPAEPAGRTEVVDPGPGNLAHEQPAVGERSGAVDGAERPWRIVGADARRAQFTDDAPAGRDEEHAAVVGVGDGAQAVGEEVCVIGRVQVAGRPPAFADVTVAPEKPPARERDHFDRVLLLLVRDDPPVPRAEEAVVVEVKREGQATARLRVAPEDSLPAVDEQDPVVAAVGDQQVARDRMRERTDAEAGARSASRAR